MRGGRVPAGRGAGSDGRESGVVGHRFCDAGLGEKSR